MENMHKPKSGGAYSPSVLVKNLKFVNRSFKPYRQEDAHEFLISLLSTMQVRRLGLRRRKFKDSAQTPFPLLTPYDMSAPPRFFASRRPMPSPRQDAELLQAGIDAKKSGWRDRLGLKRLDETSLVHRIFGGYFRSQVRAFARSEQSTENRMPVFPHVTYVLPTQPPPPTS